MPDWASKAKRKQLTNDTIRIGTVAFLAFSCLIWPGMCVLAWYEYHSQAMPSDASRL